MKIKEVPIEEVISWDKNPKNVTKKDFERLKKQIKKLGVYRPLVVCQENGQYITLGGNSRLAALRVLKYKKVDISIVRADSDLLKIEYALSDNDRIGAYDEQALAELLQPHIEEIDLDAFVIEAGEPWLDLKQVVERFGPDIDPNDEWEGMPEFGNTEKAVKTLFVHFETVEAVEEFAKMMGQEILLKTKYMWFPKKERRRMGVEFDNES